jgi:hypothetical protein
LNINKEQPCAKRETTNRDRGCSFVPCKYFSISRFSERKANDPAALFFHPCETSPQKFWNACGASSRQQLTRKWIRKRVQKLEEREEAFNKRMKKKTAFDVDTPGNASDICVAFQCWSTCSSERKEGSMTVAAKLRGRWDDSSLEKDADGYLFMDQAIAFFFQPTVEQVPSCPSLHDAT